MKRHAEEIQNEPWFTKKPWLIAGTGPSLNNYPPEDIQRQYNILAIYNAADILEADLYFCLDQDGWDYKVSKPYRYAVTRLDQKKNVPTNTLYIAMHTNPSFEGKENYPSQPSNCHALELLNRCGVTKIYTLGIDGGIGVTANGMNQDFRDHCNKCNFDDENKLFYEKADKLGVELIKL